MAGLKPRHSVPERSRWGLARPGAAFQLRRRQPGCKSAGREGWEPPPGWVSPSRGAGWAPTLARRAGWGSCAGQRCAALVGCWLASEDDQGGRMPVTAPWRVSSPAAFARGASGCQEARCGVRGSPANPDPGSSAAWAPRVSPSVALSEWTTGSGCFLILQEFSSVGWAGFWFCFFFLCPPPLSLHSPSLETFCILPLISPPPRVCPADRWARWG